MASASTHFRRFVLIVIAIGAVAYVIDFVFGALISSEATFLGLQFSTRQVVQSSIVAIAGILVVLFIRRFTRQLRHLVGPYPASVFSYVLMVLDFFVVIISVLEILNVPANSLLLGGSFGAIIVGLAVSTLFGNIFSGALMLFAKPVAVGDEVLINSMPGRIEEISTLFTKIANESGTQTILPNSALLSGAVTLTKVSVGRTSSGLPFKPGDKIYTSYVGGEGVVKGIGSLYTDVTLVGGRDVKIPNVGILNGSISIALLNSASGPEFKVTLKVSWDVEKTVKAIRAEATAYPNVFKSPIQVLYIALDNEEVELEVSGEVDASRIPEARSLILRAAYLAKGGPNT